MQSSCRVCDPCYRNSLYFPLALQHCFTKNILEMKKKATFNDIINTQKPVLVDFAAEWCGPCKMQKPILQQLVGKIGSKARVVTIDVDKNRTIAQKYQIMSVPTLAIFKGGKLVWRESGVKQMNQLETLLEKYS